MYVTGIIAEYNPFHKGHRFHIEESRRQSGADYVIAVMSDNFLQRGQAACIDKFSRARMALLQGADLVVELPVFFSCQSAPDFAQGGIEILNSTGITTHLSFGSECGNLSDLNTLAGFLEDEPAEYKDILSRHLKSGLSYPKARSTAFLEYLNAHTDFAPAYSEHLTDILNSPNNILSVAYLRSLKQTASSITPLTVQRCGCGYHSTRLDEGFASANAIRTLIGESGLSNSNLTALKEQLPDTSLEIMKEYLNKFRLVNNNAFSGQLFYKLAVTPWNELYDYGISAHLADRIRKSLSDFTDFESFTDALKRKNDSHTKIARALIHILLGIYPEDSFHMPYIRILGFRKNAKEVLHAMKKNASLPIVTKPADAKHILDEKALKLFEKELQSEQIYHSAHLGNPNYVPYNPYRQTPVIINS